MNYLALVREVERLYSPERIARSKARLGASWHLQRPPDRIPFVYTSLAPEDPTLQFDPWDGLYTDEESLRLQLEVIIDRAVLEDDYIPSLYPGCRPGTIPTTYGAREILGGGHPWVEPIIRDAQDVYALGHPDFRKDGVAAETLARIRFFRQATQGRMPIQLPDMQGPLDLASLLWGTEPLFMAMYTDPAAVHSLLQRMTDDFIAYIKLLREAAEGDLVPFHCEPEVWMPYDRGISVSEDLLAVISPRLYPTFARPYNEQIAAAFGAIVVHSCGSVEHNLAELMQTRGLIGVNFNNSETSLPAVLKAVGRQAVIIMGQSNISLHDLPLLEPEAYVRYSMGHFVASNAPAIVMLAAGSRAEALALVPVAVACGTLS